jgi:sporulation protein YlmC with PRC-barrel domain
MNTKHLKGLAVVAIADGRKLGTIGDVYVDPGTRRVVSFGLRHQGGLLQAASGPPLVVDADNVHALGTDALTVADAAVLREAAGGGRPGVVAGGDLTKRKVVTEGGIYVGEVVSGEIEPATYRLASIEVSPGFFRRSKVIPDELIVSLGADVVVVSDVVCAEVDERSSTDEGALTEAPAP